LAVNPFPDHGEGPLDGGGEMGAQLRAADWARSPLGSLESWPSALRTAAGMVLASEAPSFVTWGDEHAVFFNDALSRLLDAPGTPALGKPAREALGAWWARLGPLVLQARAGEAVQLVMDLPAAGEQGADQRHFAVSMVPVRDETGESGVHAVCVDLTAEHARWQRSERGRRKAEDESRAKDEFISVVSHELRAPLGSILIWSQLLRGDTPDAGTLERALGMIERSTRTLARLIDDLLDASRVIAGKLQVEKAPLDLAAALESVVEGERANASAKNVGVQVEIAARPVRVLGDVRRLQQVIFNLLTNAIKFTPEGGRVDVRLSHTAMQALIEVADTGIGVAADLLPGIFERFRQGDPGRSRTGLGLGLSMARHLVELHGGTIAAASPGAGQGCTFVVTLPLLQRADPIEGPAPSLVRGRRALEGLTVLLVDDEQDAREAVAVLLRQAGAGVRSVASAAEALAAVAQDHYDLVLSDIAMPIEDGYVLIRRLREEPRTAHVPAMALTAYASVEDRGKALRAGYDQHMAKPVDPTKLVAALAALGRNAVPRG
jgi:signal transduction histidine kinase/BarA-like signal transduction histidine kinase